jgi:hypothetical protein
MVGYRIFLLPIFEPDSVQGLMGGDPLLYHIMAIDLVQQIRTEGWAAWSLRPEGQAPAGVLALLYLLVGNWSMAIIPVNAAFHAGTTTALFAIASRYAPAPLALLACLPFWLSPYHMMWLSQPNKDSFSSFGAVLIIGAFLVLARALGEQSSRTWRAWAIGLLLLLAGAALAAVARPYLAKVAVVAGVAALIMFVAALVRGRFAGRALSTRAAGQILSLILVLFVIYGLAAKLQHSGVENNVDESLETALEDPGSVPWQPKGWLPKSVDYLVYAVVVSQRETFRELVHDKNVTTRQVLIDLDRKFDNAIDALLYVPRALQIGLLAPFPDLWSFFGVPSSSIFRNFLTWIMLVGYVGYALLVWALVTHRRRFELAVGTAAALVFVLAYAFATPHIGVLDRFRYPFFSCLVILGFASALGVWYQGRYRPFPVQESAAMRSTAPSFERRSRVR